MSKTTSYKIFQKVLLINLCILIMGMTGAFTELRAGHSQLKMKKYISNMENDRLNRGHRHEKKLQEEWNKPFKFKSEINLNHPYTLPLLALLVSTAILPTHVVATEQKPSSSSNTQSLQSVETETQVTIPDCNAHNTPQPLFSSLLGLNVPPNLDTSVRPSNSTASKFSSALKTIFTSVKNPNPDPEIRNDVRKYIPALDRAGVESLYSNVEFLDSGMSGCPVFKGTLRSDRETAGKGTDIALRCSKWTGENGSYHMNDHQLEAYAYLSALKGVSSYIPDIYGVWQGPFIPAFTYERFSPERLFCIEMALVKGLNYDKAYGGDYYPETGTKMTDRVLLENFIGRWAVETLGGVGINDYDGDVLRHHLLDPDPQSVVYNLGDKGTYIFPPGDSPRQIDYDSYGKLQDRSVHKKYSLHCGGWGDYYASKVSLEGRLFMKSICEQIGLFESIKKHFEKYRVSPTNPLPLQSEATYFSIPAEYLDN